MNRAVIAGEPLKPYLFHRKDQHRGEPGGQPVKQNIKHCARRAPLNRIAIAIQRVFADIEIERRQIDSCKGKNGLKYALEIIGIIAAAHLFIQFRQAVQNPLLELGHVLRRDAVAFAKIGQRAE